MNPVSENPLPDYADALKQVLAIVRPRDQPESTPLRESLRRILAEPIIADRDLPPFNRAQMDGYAVRASEVGKIESWPIVGTVAAGQSGCDISIPPGHCIKIATGAPLPDDVDTVIQHEHSDRSNPVRFTISEMNQGHAVHPRGADAGKGDTLIQPGTVLKAHHLGILAVAGKKIVSVMKRPQVSVLASGDEIVPVGDPVEIHQIRNSNGPQTDALLRKFGADPLGNTIVPDDLPETIRHLGESLEKSDLVVTLGGVSAGERDYFPPALKHHRVKAALTGAAIQPGKPIRIGLAPSGCIVVCLPGNPVSCLVCSVLFIWPIVRIMLGLDPSLPWQEVQLAESARPNPRRRAFRPARLESNSRVIIPPWAGSGDLVHTATTHGIVELPIQNTPVEIGRSLRFLPWP